MSSVGLERFRSTMDGLPWAERGVQQSVELTAEEHKALREALVLAEEEYGIVAAKAAPETMTLPYTLEWMLARAPGLESAETNEVLELIRMLRDGGIDTAARFQEVVERG